MKDVLLVIDMQLDFLIETSALFVAQSPQCIPRVVAAVEHARRMNSSIIWVVREHHPSGERRHIFYCLTRSGDEIEIPVPSIIYFSIPQKKIIHHSNVY